MLKKASDPKYLNYFLHLEVITNILVDWKRKADLSSSNKISKDLHTIANSLANIAIYVDEITENPKTNI